MRYLAKRLYKAVAEGKVDAWNASIYIADLPPSTSPQLPSWMEYAHLYRSDLIKFCKGERIRILFEDRQVVSQGVSVSPNNRASSNGNIAQPALAQSIQEPGISDQRTFSPATEPKGKGKQVDKLQFSDQTLKNFDDLPDSAFVDVKVVAALFGCSVNTVWRRVRNGQLIAPHRHGERTTRWLVGELRVALRIGK